MTDSDLPAAKLPIDAIVVTWNSAEHLPETLRALPAGLRVISVDNGSADSSAATAVHLGAEVVELGHNTGFPHAVNCGLNKVTAPFTLLLNPDLVVGPGCIERCLQELLAEPWVGAVGPATTMPDGSPEPPAARHDRRAWHIVVESLGLVHLSRRIDRQMIHDRNYDQDVDAINGGFMLVRTELLRALGGLDESVFMYLEDIDLCRRIRDAGYRVRFLAGVSAVHDAGASTRQGDPEAQVRAYLHRIDADVEFLRRYGRRGEAAAAVWAFVVRALLGLAVSLVRPERRERYRQALGFSLAQVRGRRPAPPV